MKEIQFAWDENKNRTNLAKHGIAFAEAVTVFYDEDAVLFDDPDHSESEERFLILGFSRNARLCIVSHCYRDGGVIRIISARKATKRESAVYQQYRKGG